MKFTEFEKTILATDINDDYYFDLEDHKKALKFYGCHVDFHGWKKEIDAKELEKILEIKLSDKEILKIRIDYYIAREPHNFKLWQINYTT